MEWKHININQVFMGWSQTKEYRVTLCKVHQSVITLKSLTSEVKNTDYLLTMVLVKGAIIYYTSEQSVI